MRGSRLAAVCCAGGGSYPAWRAAQLSATWGIIPSLIKLSDINPQNNPLLNSNYPSTAIWAGSGGQTCIIHAWNSMLINPATCEVHKPLSGGHSDYAGNEYYKATLWAAATSWRMVRPPSGAIGNLITLDDGQEATGAYADGRLRSTHSYNNQVWIPGLGPMLTRQGSQYKDPGPQFYKMWLFDENTGESSLYCDYSAIGVAFCGSPEGGSCFDRTRGTMGTIWHCGTATAKMLKTDVALKTTIAVGTWDNHIQGNARPVYIEAFDCVAYMDGTPSFKIFDCATSLWYTITITGSFSAGFDLNGHSGMDWDAANGRMLLWNNVSNTIEISTLTPTGNPRTAPWVAGVLPVSGSNIVVPTNVDGTGVWGRFGIALPLNGCYLLNAVNQPFYFFAF